MSSYEISILKKTPGSKSELWKMAFKEYNQDPENKIHLNMACTPCWFKVLKYHMKKNNMSA
jgi:hypothetical protein